MEETGIIPATIFTDSDPALISSIKNVYPLTNHILCIFHIDLNLKKNLRRKLGSKFETFHSDFYICHNSLCKDLFESRWTKLLKDYPTVTKYLNTLYCSKESWATPWINKIFTAGAQSTQRIESINMQIHQKVDRATSLCNLLTSLNNYVDQEEHLMNFEIQRNILPTTGLPLLSNQFFPKVDETLKQFLTPTMLGKQRDQMNMSVCYDVVCVENWNELIESHTDNGNVGLWVREQEHETCQILFTSLIQNIPHEKILQVWHVRYTGTSGHGHYVILLNDSTHLCTCLLLINKGLICRHFFRVGTYSPLAIFHIALIPNHWYLEPNITSSDLFQQIPATFISISERQEVSDVTPQVTLEHLTLIRQNCNSNGKVTTKPIKARYAKLSGLSKKVVGLALKADLSEKLSGVLNTFLHEAQDKISASQKHDEDDESDNSDNSDEYYENYENVNNPIITKHKGRPPKRLKSSVEETSNKGKHQLKDNMSLNIINKDLGTGSSIKEVVSNNKGRN